MHLAISPSSTSPVSFCKLTPNVSGFMEYLYFCDWIIALSTVSERTAFLLKVGQHFIVYVLQILCILSVDGHLGCIFLLDLMNYTSMNMAVKIVHLWLWLCKLYISEHGCVNFTPVTMDVQIIHQWVNLTV